MKYLYLTRVLDPYNQVIYVNTEKILFFEARNGPGTNLIFNISENEVQQISVTEDIVNIKEWMEQ